SALLKHILLNISTILNSKILSIKWGLRSISTLTTSLSIFEIFDIFERFRKKSTNQKGLKRLRKKKVNESKRR
ncbi:28139_t:CDS:1, partial [Dentiscutata erythropus]